MSENTPIMACISTTIFPVKNMIQIFGKHDSGELGHSMKMFPFIQIVLVLLMLEINRKTTGNGLPVILKNISDLSNALRIMGA